MLLTVLNSAGQLVRVAVHRCGCTCSPPGITGPPIGLGPSAPRTFMMTALPRSKHSLPTAWLSLHAKSRVAEVWVRCREDGCGEGDSPAFGVAAERERDGDGGAVLEYLALPVEPPPGRLDPLHTG